MARKPDYSKAILTKWLYSIYADSIAYAVLGFGGSNTRFVAIVRCDHQLEMRNEDNAQFITWTLNNISCIHIVYLNWVICFQRCATVYCSLLFFLLLCLWICLRIQRIHYYFLFCVCSAFVRTTTYNVIWINILIVCITLGDAWVQRGNVHLGNIPCPEVY